MNQPGDPQQLLQQAFADHQAGRLREAEAGYRGILAIQPNHADALHLLGYLANQIGRPADAVELISQAIRLQPGTAIFHNNLALALLALGRLEEADANTRRAIQLDATLGPSFLQLGIILMRRGRVEEAADAWRHATILMPESADAHSNLAFALTRLKRPAEAIASAKRAIALRPDLAQAHNNLGDALQLADDYDASAAALDRAIELQPSLVEARVNRGSLAVAAGEVENGIEHFRRAIEIDPNDPQGWDNLLLALHYRSIEPRALFDEHARWGKRMAESEAALAFPAEAGSLHAPAWGMSRDEERRLRVGYVSSDFRRHSVTYFIEPILERHNRGAFEVFCYSGTLAEDEVTDRLKALPVTWRNITSLSDDEAAGQIRQDAIDLLIDLSGHTGQNRLGIFARRAAPVQLTYLGYPNTTGLGEMDCRITDAIADPPGEAEALHTERLLRLPACAWCYRPPADAPSPVRELSARGGSPRDSARGDDLAHPPASRGTVTFGCFNALTKIAPETIAAWARILEAVPHSRLLLKSKPLQQESVRRRVLERFAAAGVSLDRLELLPRTPELREHLAQYSRIDIAMDTFPYNGTTTTCEALWMGVPVVTLKGRAHASRVGASLLSAAGLSDCVAETVDEYVAIAARLAAGSPRDREGVRRMMSQSVLRDEAAFVANFESALRNVWRTWCQDNPIKAG